MGYRAFAICIALFTVFFLDAHAQYNPISCPETAQYYSKDSINVVTFGASTVEGVKGLNFQSYLIANFNRCYSGKVVDMTNNGIGGERTQEGLARIDAAILGKTGFIIIDMGVNDALAIFYKGETTANTVANMRLLIEKSLKAGLIPILCTLQSIDDRTKSNNKKINLIIKELNTAYIKLGTEYKIKVADINRAFRNDFSLYQDEFHPNARGYRIMGYVLFDTINKIIADRFLQFTVTQNYPNPVITTTNIDVVLPEADKVEIKIYDILGRVAMTVLNEDLNNGKHTFIMDLSALAPGVYIYKLTTSSGNYRVTKKMIVVH